MRRDTIVGFFAVILGALYTVITVQLPRASIGSPTAPLVFPAILGGLMIAFGAGVLYVDRKKAIASGFAAEKKAPKDEGYWKLVVGTVILCGLYGVAFEHFGYMISTLCFLMALLTLVNQPHRWKANISITAIFTVALWVVFVYGFQLNLPSYTQGGFF